MQNQMIFILLLVVQVVLIITLIVLNSKTSAKNKEMTKLLTRYKDRLREDELDDAIRNELYKQNQEESDQKYVPYDVHYTDEEEVRSTEAVCVHFQCEGRLAIKKYLLNLMDDLYIGTSKSNGIVLDEYDVDEKHIHFVRQGKLLFVQNVSEGMPVSLRRGKTKYPLTDTLVQVNDGDTIEFKTSQVLVSLI